MAEPVAAAQMRVRLRNGDVHDVDTKPGDLVHFEREFKVSAGKLKDLAETGEARFEWTVYLAWRALKRKQVFEGDFDEFLDEIDDVESEAGTDAPGEAKAGSEPGGDDPANNAPPTEAAPAIS